MADEPPNPPIVARRPDRAAMRRDLERIPDRKFDPPSTTKRELVPVEKDDEK